MEISGTSNTYFVGTDVTPYGCSRDGMATVPYTIKINKYFHIENCCNRNHKLVVKSNLLSEMGIKITS